MMATPPLKAVALLAGVVILAATWSSAEEPSSAEKPLADSMLGKEAGDVRDDNWLKIKLAWCPPGFLTMEQLDIEGGALKGKTPVTVFVTRGYWIGRYEVTQAEWRQVMGTKPWEGQPDTKEGDDFPAAYINRNDATEFCARLTKSERDAARLPKGWEFALPTEAQWERACRARTETRFSFGDDESELGDYAWFVENTFRAGEGYPHRVGQKKANSWGLSDMHGNVYEWCRDAFAEKLPGGRDPAVMPDADPPGSSSARVLRGGGWAVGASEFGSAWRSRTAPSKRFSFVGFRVALGPVRPAP